MALTAINLSSSSGTAGGVSYTNDSPLRNRLGRFLISSRENQESTITFDETIHSATVYVDAYDGGEDFGLKIDGVLINLKDVYDGVYPNITMTPVADIEFNSPNDGYVDGLNDNQHAGYTITITQSFDSLTLLSRTELGGKDNGMQIIIRIDPDAAPVVCFMNGTLIYTEDGDRPIEELEVGDRVKTANGGYQEIRWISSRLIQGRNLRPGDSKTPICIRAGALGMNTPSQDLYVSKHHRILVNSSVVKNIYTDEKVLVAAKDLLPIDGVDHACNMDEFQYFHFIFEDHQVVFANGTACETLYLGAEAIKTIPPAALRELYEIFPELEFSEYQPQPVYKLVQGKTAKMLVQRIRANNKFVQNMNT